MISVRKNSQKSVVNGTCSSLHNDSKHHGRLTVQQVFPVFALQTRPPSQIKFQTFTYSIDSSPCLDHCPLLWNVYKLDPLQFQILWVVELLEIQQDIACFSHLRGWEAENYCCKRLPVSSSMKPGGTGLPGTFILWSPPKQPVWTLIMLSIVDYI